MIPPLILLILGGAVFGSALEETETILRADRAASNQSESLTNTDIALSRTLNIIAKKTERGRLILLLCPFQCHKAKRMVPEWIRSFNEEQEYPIPERISYHFHLAKQPLPFIPESRSITGPTLLFMIGNEIYWYEADIFDKESLLKWVAELDTDDVIYPRTYQELDKYLNTPNCTDKYLIYSPLGKCEIPQWRTIARIVRLKMQISTIYLPRPFRNNKMATVFLKRLSILREHECLLMTFVQLNHYTNHLPFTTPAQIVDHLISMVTSNECVMMEYNAHPIRPALSDLEMGYYSGERAVNQKEQSMAYLVVGATSGIAVVALAISIFWGLNGSAFASK